MGDVIREFPVRSGTRERSRPLKLYFDTGSPFTFVKRSVAHDFVNFSLLGRPVSFGGLGNGRFLARAVVHIEVKMLGYWCRHVAYVVEDETLGSRYDLLIGHDYMQRFDVTVRTRNRRRGVVLHREAIELAQSVR